MNKVCALSKKFNYVIFVNYKNTEVKQKINLETIFKKNSLILKSGKVSFSNQFISVMLVKFLYFCK